MFGAIAGDVIGANYDGYDIKQMDFDMFGPGSKFTDDTVLTVAIADCILNSRNYAQTIREYGLRYR